MKILYAASGRRGAANQLNRFLIAIAAMGHTVKIAAYHDIKCVSYIDWNLDALLNIFDPSKISFENDNLEIYYDQVKHFKPDLIISDLEIFTSHIATLLNIPTFQIGPRLLYQGLVNKNNIGLFKQYSHLLKQNIEQITQHMLDTADCNLVYSHLCDIAEPPPLRGGFEFVRPYHILGEPKLTCKHRVVAISSSNDRPFIQFLNTYEDAVLFTDFNREKYPEIALKDISNSSEYACNLKNCDHFISRGSAEHLADAFYNHKFAWVFPNFVDQEAIINSIVNERFGLGKVIYDPISKFDDIETPEPHYNANVLYLHERLNDF
jgi:hypothetical protein